jgi:uncharacterized protein YdeI (YjbR/CyaY-like superfamily)
MPKTPAHHPKVDAYFARAQAWRPEMGALRAIALACGLVEELKWGQPCYTQQGKNIGVIGPFKEYCAFIFFKGALLKDEAGLLKQPGQAQSGRMARFTQLKEIRRRAPPLKAYLQEAMALEAAGKKVALKQTKDFPVPAELSACFKAQPALKAAFQALTPGRQRAYLLHFAGAKQAATREARIAKWAPKILKGLGMTDD